ncbi:hypothetical protein RhiirA4_468365 [Rhizophagus irregularis]|uniref:Uncharacterized protein n=1 Tax=Rhizophagus irregularis TaxID=588596 RepID=A0A2I1GXL5_9GLOM|nr:hypothetical protein RhiirA4_468365 [Rhizophagus irregularis]
MRERRTDVTTGDIISSDNILGTLREDLENKNNKRDHKRKDIMRVYRGIKKFNLNLSQTYIEILEDNEYYDVTIEVGGSKCKNNSCTYDYSMSSLFIFTENFNFKQKRIIDVLAHIKLSNNISPETFQIILR